jgi:hypothetical protein
VSVALACCFVLSGRISQQEERAAAEAQAACPAAAPPVAYGRPQHIPAAKVAELRESWDKVGDLESVDEAARGGA